LAAGSLRADFSYRETTKVTGGMMAGALKMAGVFSKAAREPMDSTVAVKGNRMAHRSASHLSVIDLDRRTITEADLQKKTYSVLTFDEMKQALENLSNKMKEKQNGEMNLKVSADATGKSKEIGGFKAGELVMKITMEATDQKNGQKGSMVVISDVWMSEDVPGYAEVAEFSRKMAAELNWTPGSSPFLSQPQIAKGMSEAAKEMSKLKGAPVFQTIVMGPEGIAPPSSDGPQPAAQQEKPKPSAGRLLGGALGGRLGGLGRKKEEPADEPPPQAASSSNQGALIEMQTEYSAFSTTADASLFEIPAGFKQVESEMKKMK
jgi:hypothetical protein